VKHPSRHPCGKTSSTQWLTSWLGVTAGLDTLQKRIITCLFHDSNLSSPVCPTSVMTSAYKNVLSWHFVHVIWRSKRCAVTVCRRYVCDPEEKLCWCKWNVQSGKSSVVLLQYVDYTSVILRKNFIGVTGMFCQESDTVFIGKPGFDCCRGRHLSRKTAWA
jgi:hypothetical protein